MGLCASHLLNERKTVCLRKANRMPSLRGAGRGMSRFQEKASMKREAAVRSRPAKMGARRFLARRRARNRFRLGVSGQYRRRQSLLMRRSGVVLANGKGRLSGILLTETFSAQVRLGHSSCSFCSVVGLKVASGRLWSPTSHEKRARYGAPDFGLPIHRSGLWSFRSLLRF
jgi:hypothetical protein